MFTKNFTFMTKSISEIQCNVAGQLS